MGSLAMRGKRLLVHGWPKNPLICWSLRFDICHVSCIWSMDSRTLNGSTWRETSSRTFEYRELRSYLDTTVWTFRKIQLINQQPSHLNSFTKTPAALGLVMGDFQKCQRLSSVRVLAPWTWNCNMFFLNQNLFGGHWQSGIASWESSRSFS